MISLTQAHQHINMLSPLPPVIVPLEKALGLICAVELRAATSCPTVDSSLKDGFAVLSTDIANATVHNPVTLTVAGALTAGDDVDKLCVQSGTAIRIMTGASIPSGATAVLASEFTRGINAEQVIATADAAEGRNILRKGSDIVQDQIVAHKGDLLSPAHLGLLAAAGLNEVLCYPVPKVAVVATGSELVLPGEPVTVGKVAASNMVTAAAELQRLGVHASTILIRDNLEQLQAQFKQLVQQVDVLITCGGVLDGDKDLTMRAMEQIGMEKIFHRVRIGPGKGACMGRVGDTVVFNLPGGPPSNHVALLLLALPGVRKLMGFSDPLPPKNKVIMAEEFNGQKNWTQLIYSGVKQEQGSFVTVPADDMSRFEAMAEADILIEIPEGCTGIGKAALAGAWFVK
jgi:molybdopterin molybdotransferase